ncbi:MAG: 16S rRNA (cytosine1402-N4)-methyltransferase [Verrucomicrobiales bacterium]|jgi:16S rRNA (cytosine1402-N4)-methyltransferase
MQEDEKPHRRRERYRGTHPRRFEQKYKELDPELDPETVAKVIASGKTPAGQHRPILVDEILAQLDAKPGGRGADVTLGYGGHSEAILKAIQPGGQLLALDVDAKQLPQTEARLRHLGYGEEQLMVRRSNYAGLAAVLAEIGWSDGVDFLLADLGLSSMQIDNPVRGFSYKNDGPLDMRMNPERGLSARDWLAKCGVDKLTRVLVEGGDEPRAEEVAAAITASAKPIETTRQLRRCIESALASRLDEDAIKATVTRVFQAIRIAVNEEFTAIDAFLNQLPYCLRPGGRVAVLSFHSGEDRRVKHHFREGVRGGIYAAIATEIIRPSPAEIGGNSRAAPAKLRWAVRAGTAD